MVTWLQNAQVVTLPVHHANSPSFYLQFFTLPKPSLVLPFELRGFNGKVNVYYRGNTDPERWGCHFLKVPFDHHDFEGFPVFQADMEFSGEGCAAVMGWVQLVTVHDFTTNKQSASVDQSPIFWKADHPFYEFGYKADVFRYPWSRIPHVLMSDG